MAFITTHGIEYYTFSSLNNLNVRHGIFTRNGGVSPQPWASLNLGGTVGDSRANVIENRQRIFAALQRPVESLFDVWQVHSKDVICSDDPRPLDKPHQRGDAILTINPNITLFMRFADCVPILLYDPVRRAAGIVHAGWKGTVIKVAAEAVYSMTTAYGCDPADVIACIGPSIGPNHYQVGEDVVSEVNEAFGNHSGSFLTTVNHSQHFDLWKANAWILEEAGVKSIEVASICTACDLERWYSHRAEQGKTGRFGALLNP